MFSLLFRTEDLVAPSSLIVSLEDNQEQAGAARYLVEMLAIEEPSHKRNQDSVPTLPVFIALAAGSTNSCKY
ncbi:hypothetical protein D5086_000528 [Populus alba]|uniref:Uncharacterized protein n=1 Tax=Populus alba TaxID=43335 RepID=A0ACC4CWK6_POPAL